MASDPVNQALEVAAAPTLSDRERTLLLHAVGHALREHLAPLRTGDKATTSHVRSTGVSEEIRTPLGSRWGAFVSIYRGDSLRGCIGQVTGHSPLQQTVTDMAIAAATRDPRFDRVAIDELPHLSYEISVLGPRKSVPAETRARLPSTLIVGVHGLQISRRKESGLLLPQVAEKFGWTAVEFLAETAAKAGLDEDAWRDPGTEVFVFRALRFSGRS